MPQRHHKDPKICNISGLVKSLSVMANDRRDVSSGCPSSKRLSRLKYRASFVELWPVSVVARNLCSGPHFS